MSKLKCLLKSEQERANGNCGWGGTPDTWCLYTNCDPVMPRSHLDSDGKGKVTNLIGMPGQQQLVRSTNDNK